MSKYLISFGDENYSRQKAFFTQTAVMSGFFDSVKISVPEDISPVFAAKVSSVIQLPKGRGYWLWKPFFIKQVLDSINVNDILMYCDVGCLINPGGKQRFNEYLDMLNDSDTGTVDFELPHKEYEFTKQEIFQHFECQTNITDTNQLMATVLLFRKCQHTMNISDIWYETARDYPSLFTDDTTLPQNENYVAPRHDQSIFSVIRKQWGANNIPDETYFKDFNRDGQDFPIWATRLRG
ncbi:hypothetical protein SAMN06265348_11780 [Pedobacter westerhofensis]|uniref:Uncharacterized protein n=1 Tax=Pedobacter westerhofensis TaxID=425512 RepID=A0A521FRK6_9SPHI|nr:hypothetical protein [Pedobacter westerhofensis]SMO98694.1 hypothetical protein SAMN06265348_11780 [Pedobacter westerhofensis]